MRRLPWMVARIVAFAVLAVLCWTFWKQNAQLKREIEELKDVNRVLREAVDKASGAAE